MVLICNVVLHFAESEHHFFEMLDELFSVLKPYGSLLLSYGEFELRDNSARFLVTPKILNTLINYTTIKLRETLKNNNWLQ